MQTKNIMVEYLEYQQIEELTPIEQEVLQKAKAAVLNARAELTNFKVGAAALLEDGSIYVSSNKENLTKFNCAEQNLLSYLHSLNVGKKIKYLAVSFKNCNSQAKSDYPLSPCGICRQVLLEEEAKQASDIKLIMQGEAGKIVIMPSISSLLPLAFYESKFK